MACAFLLALSAAGAIVIAITNDANRLEAFRHRDRVAAALTNQSRLRQLRLENLSATGEMQAAMRDPYPLQAVRRSFVALSSRFLEFDGAYIVTASGQVLAGVEGGQPAGQAGYEGLKHYSFRIPGASPATQKPVIASTMLDPSTSMAFDGHEALAFFVAELKTVRNPTIAAALGPISIVGYRLVTNPLLAELSARYQVSDVTLSTSAPADNISGLPIAGPDGSVSAWLVWSPERPGAAMLEHRSVMHSTMRCGAS